MDSLPSVVEDPQTAAEPHTAAFPANVLEPQTAAVPQRRVSEPQTAAAPLTKTLLPQTAAAPNRSPEPQTAAVPAVVLEVVRLTVLVDELNTARGEAAVAPAGTRSALFRAPQTSRYPAPMVKISY